MMNVEYTMDINFDDIKRELSKNHKVANIKAVRKAYEYAATKHEGQKRKTGEPYIMHPLRVARFVAKWGFPAELVSASLLHDVVEDCNTPIEEIEKMFGSNVAEIVDSVTDLHNELKKTGNLTKEEIDHLSDLKLKEKMTESALFLKAADRLDNLYTISGVSDETKRINKAIHTREIIIPMLMREGAYQIIDQLEVLCLRIEHPERYTTIKDIYRKMIDTNSFTTQKVLKLFEDVFQPGSVTIPTDFRSYSDYITRFKYNLRSSISVYRQINAEAENINNDLARLLCKENVAMYDLTLIINDETDSASGMDRPSDLTPTDIFFKIYEGALMNCGIYIVGNKQTTYGDSTYVVLRDEMDNLYRLFIKTETEYMRYKLGHVIDMEDYNLNPDSDIDSNKIKVFTKSGEAKYIENGATMLDFAFMIHSEIGFHFEYAMVDNNKTQRKAYDRLSPGDTVTIVTNPEIEPEIKWFKYVKTEKAVEHLIKYFESCLQRTNRKSIPSAHI